MKTTEKIKNTSFSDFRHHLNGVVCDIYECIQLNGMSAVLKVLPVGYLNSDKSNKNSQLPSGEEPRYFNVPFAYTPGIFGFNRLIKDIYYAYVITSDPTKIEGCPAILIPKTSLGNGVHKNSAGNMTEPDMLDKVEIEALTMKKENLIPTRMFK